MSWLIFLILTAACEIRIRSNWAKKLVSCLGQWDDLLDMGKLGRWIPSYNLMLLIWWNWPVIDLSHHLGIMASWISPLKGIYAHLHHLVPGPWTEPKQHNVVLWAWEVILGHGKYDKVIWSFSWLRFLKMTPACEICVRSHWVEKLVSSLIQWDYPLAMDKLRSGIPSYYAMLQVWWNWWFFDLSYRLGIMASSKSLAKGI